MTTSRKGQNGESTVEKWPSLSKVFCPTPSRASGVCSCAYTRGFALPGVSFVGVFGNQGG